MKSEAAIKARLRALLVKELDRRVEEASKRLPRRCTHNHRQPLDARKTVDGEPNPNYNRITNGHGLPVLQTIGLCMLNADDPDNPEWNLTICEEPIDAQRCPFFEAKQDKATLLTEFWEQLETPGWVEEHMPGVAVLAWALDQATTPKLPWWKLMWFFLLRIRIEPVREVKNLDALLGPVDELPEANDEGVSP